MDWTTEQAELTGAIDDRSRQSGFFCARCARGFS